MGAMRDLSDTLLVDLPRITPLEICLCLVTGRLSQCFFPTPIPSSPFARIHRPSTRVLFTLETMGHGVKTEKANDLISSASDHKQETSPSTEADNDTRSAIDGALHSKELDTILRHVSDKIPWAAWLVVVFSSAERFSYFAFTGPLRKCATFAPSKKTDN